MKYIHHAPCHETGARDVDINESAFASLLVIHGYKVKREGERIIVNGMAIVDGADYCFPLELNGHGYGWVKAFSAAN